MRAAGSATHGGARRRARHRSRPSWPAAALVSVALVAAVAGGVWLADVAGGGRTGGAGADGAAPSPAEEVSRTLVLIGDDGTLRVEQRVALLAPVDRLDLSVPVRRGAAAAISPRVVDVTVRSGGSEWRVATPLRQGAEKQVRLARETTQAVVTYVATHVTLRSHPSNPERALALATPLVIEQAAGLPSRVDIESVKALNVGCVSRGGEMAGCGTHTSSGWTVEASGSEPYVDVVVQLNLAVP